MADPAFVAFLDPGENFPRAAALSASVGATILLVVTTLWLKRRPDRVRQVRRETADAWTLTFEPDGHEGLRFGPGQFVWLTLGDTPFSLQQHPFSFSSSAERRDVAEVTIKAVGDFTHTVGRVPVGTRGPCT